MGCGPGHKQEGGSGGIAKMGRKTEDSRHRRIIYEGLSEQDKYTRALDY